MLKIDLSNLLKGLEALPHTAAPKPKKVSPYVLAHILKPLKTDDFVSFADLDFSAFTEEDLDDLRDALSVVEDRQYRLNRLCSAFCHSEPKAASQRKFC
mgnify:FL=1